MKIKHYVDLQDGPSSLQKREGIPTIQEKSKTPLLYESERKDHMDRTESNKMALTSIRDVLFQQQQGEQPVQGVLRSPREARAELQALKEQLRSVQDFNEQKRFLGKRDRIIRTGWRHGIVGVDDADSESTQVFYQSSRQQKNFSLADKDMINKRRQKRKYNISVYPA